MSTADEIRAYHTLRLIALITEDPLAREFALDVVGETQEQARQALRQTCWEGDIDDLRQAVFCQLSDAKRAARHPEDDLEGGWEALTRHTDDAYAAGIAAFETGASVSANPHPPGSYLHPAWAAGWSDGQRQNEVPF